MREETEIDNICKIFSEYMKKTTKKAKKEPKKIQPPQSARLVKSYYNPLGKGNNLILMVKSTKARIYVWRAGVWTIETPEEAHRLMGSAQLEQDRRTAEAQRIWRAQAFVDRMRWTRLRREATTRRDELLASIEEAALRMTIKARTLEERMRINDEKEALEDQIREAFYGSDEDDEEFVSFDEPEIPDAWIIMSANPSSSQGNFKF